MDETATTAATVGAAAVRYAMITDAFSAAELALAADGDPDETVVRDVLTALAREGWVAQVTDDPTLWTAGSRAEELRCTEVPTAHDRLCTATGCC